MFHRWNKGQTALEYMVLIIVLIGALLAIQNYFKRGLQGRWKAAMDDMGDQYDPRLADSAVRYTLVQSTNTSIWAVSQPGGNWTMRTDESISTERKQGNVQAGAY